MNTKSPFIHLFYSIFVTWKSEITRLNLQIYLRYKKQKCLRYVLPAKVWGREESKYPNEGEYKHHVIDLFGQQRHGVLVGGLHRNTSVLNYM